MSIDRTTVLLRPSLRFIATLPTLKLKEAVWCNVIEWRVRLDEPVRIMYDDFPILYEFWVIAETIRDFTPTGRKYDLRISIYRKLPINFTNVIIEPVDEDFYIHRKWWNWVEKETNEN